MDSERSPGDGLLTDEQRGLPGSPGFPEGLYARARAADQANKRGEPG